MPTFQISRALNPEGKAIGNHPVFHDNVPTVTYAPGASRQDARISQREAKRHLDGYGGGQAIDYLMDAVDLYATTTSTAAWRLLDEDGIPMVRKKTPAAPPEYKVGPEDLYTLLDQPNPHMLYDELMCLLVIDLLLVGNGYWLKWSMDAEGKPASLFRLAPQYMNIIPGKWGPKRYEYQPPGAKDPMKIAPAAVLHFRRPNPNHAHYGMGIVKGGGRAFDIELAVTETQASYYENRADPSLIIQSERRVPRDIFNKLRAQLRSRTSGSDKAGELLLLEAGLKATTLSRSAADAMFVEVSHLSRDRIFAMFRASPKLFGFQDQSAGADKIGDARREFDTYVIRPFMDKLQRLITFGLTQAWNTTFDIEYRYVMPLEELVKNAGLVAAVPGVKVREIRRFLGPIGISESTGDAEIDEMVLNLPGEELDEDGQGGSADRNLPGEAGRPPKGENTSSFNQAVSRAGAKSLDAILDDFRMLEARAGAKAVENAAGERVTVGNRLQGEQAPPDPFAPDRAAAVDDVTAAIHDGLSEAMRGLERELLDHVEGKAFRPNNLRSRLRNSPAWKTFSDRVEAVLMDAARRSVSQSVMQSGRVVDEDLDYDAIAESVVKRPEGLRAIVRTTKERLLSRIADKLDAKDVTQQMIQAEVQTFAREWSDEDGHSMTIALSEAVESYNEGTLSVAEILGLTEVYVSDGEEHDQECADANGQLWPIAHARANRKAHPRCRRNFLMPNAVA